MWAGPLAMTLMMRRKATVRGRLISREMGAANSLRAAPLATACRAFLSTAGTPRRGGSQRSEVDWDKADAQLARLSEHLGVTARAETYHAQDNTVTLTLYTESGTKETTLPLTMDFLGEWSTG